MNKIDSIKKTVPKNQICIINQLQKNKCQYIEVDYNQRLDDTKKSNELSSSPKKLISNKLNTQKFHEEYGVAGPSSRTSQELIFITSFDDNEEDKKKANKKKAKSKKKQENWN
ncbi:hypothetical protein C1645_743703 [Glomus cerebriforme]|uniref:Uncharacterized protein n=1 Tax=Glomus cerebriforme TaxID=658196 RepID=A0A397S898_9GLOM|nr:hypothetical protein C1645_743703 [Glomus cerebriforme]